MRYQARTGPKGFGYHFTKSRIKPRQLLTDKIALLIFKGLPCCITVQLPHRRKSLILYHLQLHLMAVYASPLDGNPLGANPLGANPLGANPQGANPLVKSLSLTKSAGATLFKCLRHCSSAGKT